MDISCWHAPDHGDWDFVELCRLLALVLLYSAASFPPKAPFADNMQFTAGCVRVLPLCPCTC